MNWQGSLNLKSRSLVSSWAVIYAKSILPKSSKFWPTDKQLHETDTHTLSRPVARWLRKAFYHGYWKSPSLRLLAQITHIAHLLTTFFKSSPHINILLAHSRILDNRFSRHSTKSKQVCPQVHRPSWAMKAATRSSCFYNFTRHSRKQSTRWPFSWSKKTRSTNLFSPSDLVHSVSLSPSPPPLTTIVSYFW